MAVINTIQENGYGNDSIIKLDDMAHIRLRSSAYIEDRGARGLRQLCKELIDNSADELELLGTGCIDTIMFINDDRSSFKLAVIDNGRGIPKDRLIDSFSSARTSGKFDQQAYQFSSGLFGIGSTTVCALSEWFRAIALNKDGIGDATITHDNIPDKINEVPNELNRTGTIVLFQPDSTIFENINEFIEDSSYLIEYLIHMSMFIKYQIRLFIVDYDLPPDLLSAPSLNVIDYLERITTSTQPTYDSSILDRQQYIESYFGIQRWHGNYPIVGATEDGKLRVEGALYIFLGNTSGSNNKLTFVNNILFTDNTSLHIALLIKAIKTKMAILISDKTLRSFFDNHYNLPIWMVLNVKYSGAQFTGFSKTSFRDVSFRAPYIQLLNEIISSELVEDMYRLMLPHIETAYQRFSNSDFKPSTMRSLMSKLNRPDKFNNCSTNNRSLAELFLVEGDSAKSDQGRDSEYQGVYTLGGKPFNGLTTQDKLAESINNIKRNAVFEDIIRIMNIVPGSDDLSKMNFGKVLIMADADTHGYHITNIVIGNLYAICPKLVEEGRVYITISPLYSLNVKGGNPIYLRNVTELNAMLSYHVYNRFLDISIESDVHNHTLSREEFTAFAEIVIRIGDELDRLSEEYVIPALLLEQLSLVTSQLNLKHPNIQELQKWLGYELHYIPANNLLIVSIGSDDVVVPLTQITELIYERILPLYREFYYGRTRIFATTKETDFMKHTPITIIQLHEIFKKLGSMFSIERYKGLGSLPPVDRARNCVNPATRRVYQISSIGDIDRLYDMLGTDATARKRLISV